VIQLLQNVLIVYALIVNIVDDIIFLFTLIGVVQFYFLDIMGITRYYHEINEKNAILFLVFVVICSVLVFFIAGNNMAVIFNNIFVLGIQIYMIITPLIKFKDFKSKIGTSGKWYYITFISGALLIPIAIYTNSLGYKWGVYDAESTFIIFLFHTPVLIAHMFLILFIVHLEYISTNEKKNDLKDKYSHNLGNIMQSISSAQELINNKMISKEEATELEGIIETKIDEASKLIREIREL